jgi:hypothetical protein
MLSSSSLKKGWLSTSMLKEKQQHASIERKRRSREKRLNSMQHQDSVERRRVERERGLNSMHL